MSDNVTHVRRMLPDELERLDERALVSITDAEVAEFSGADIGRLRLVNNALWNYLIDGTYRAWIRRQYSPKPPPIAKPAPERGPSRAEMDKRFRTETRALIRSTAKWVRTKTAAPLRDEIQKLEARVKALEDENAQLKQGQAELRKHTRFLETAPLRLPLPDSKNLLEKLS